jgi:hypothetical protein
MLVADVVGLPHALGERQVIFLQLGQHVFGGDEIRIIVLDLLHPGDVADRADRCAADFAGSFRDFVRHRENLRGLLIKKEVIIPQMRGLICSNGCSWS